MPGRRLTAVVEHMEISTASTFPAGGDYLRLRVEVLLPAAALRKINLGGDWHTSIGQAICRALESDDLAVEVSNGIVATQVRKIDLDTES